MSPQLGAFARTWSEPGPGDIARAMAQLGLRHAQWNFRAIGRPTISNAYTADDFTEVKTAFDAAGVSLWGLSGTYNIIDADQERRESLTRALKHMIQLAPLLGVATVTICTGSNDPDSMWRWHPGNDSDASWNAALTVIGRLAKAAAASGVRIGIEPETANVVSDAARAERLLAELGPGAAVGIVLDSANLLSVDTLADQQRVLTDAFARLGPWVVGLHAKDVVAESRVGAAGHGGLDYELIASLHRQYTPAAPVIIQDATVEQLPEVIGYLRRAWDAVPVTADEAHHA